MTKWVALLHAVNVGGTGKLAMADLRRLCGEAGFRDAAFHLLAPTAQSAVIARK